MRKLVAVSLLVLLPGCAFSLVKIEVIPQSNEQATILAAGLAASGAAGALTSHFLGDSKEVTEPGHREWIEDEHGQGHWVSTE